MFVTTWKKKRNKKQKQKHAVTNRGEEKIATGAKLEYSAPSPQFFFVTGQKIRWYYINLATPKYLRPGRPPPLPPFRTALVSKRSVLWKSRIKLCFKKVAHILCTQF